MFVATIWPSQLTGGQIAPSEIIKKYFNKTTEEAATIISESQAKLNDTTITTDDPITLSNDDDFWCLGGKIKIKIPS